MRPISNWPIKLAAFRVDGSGRIGVPSNYASRSAEDRLTLREIKDRVGASPVLFVYVGEQTLGTREGINLATPPFEQGYP
jgi:hypothetical protein